MTPKMIFSNVSNSNAMANDNINDLVDLMEEYELSDKSTVAEYKYKAFLKYIINNQPIKQLERNEIKNLAARWSGLKNINIREFSENDSIMNFEKSGLSALRKRVMLPLDRFFINLGNDALKLFKGGKNEGNEPKVIDQIRKSIVNAIGSIQETGNIKSLDKLEYLLFRLGNTVDINASEGIVFKYNGKFYKLTGTFAVINQIIDVSRKSDNIK